MELFICYAYDDTSEYSIAVAVVAAPSPEEVMQKLSQNRWFDLYNFRTPVRLLGCSCDVSEPKILEFRTLT